ncbi:MAG: polysaccharide deacetylase [Clostridiales bacterium]|nr:polysaccharide deacetylase [Clostridiales bacterium]
MNKITYKFFQKYIANFIIILAIISISILTYQGGVIGAFSSNNTQPIFCGKEHNNTISLMFNVYMGNEYVEQIINVLEKNNVKATFFVGGIWVEKNNDCFMKIYNSGNEIASHGYWHKDHSKITDQQQINEINLTHELVRDLTGINMTLFAPPSGAYNKMTAQIAESLGYKTIMWSKDTIDWRDQDEELLYTRATNAAQAGDLILMHPTQATANCLDKIIKKYIELGLNIDTVSKNIS